MDINTGIDIKEVHRREKSAESRGQARGIVTGVIGTAFVGTMIFATYLGITLSPITLGDGEQKMEFREFGTVKINGTEFNFVQRQAKAGGEHPVTFNFSQFNAAELQRVATLAQKTLNQHIADERAKGNTLPNWVIGSEDFFRHYASLAPAVEAPAPGM